MNFNFSMLFLLVAMLTLGCISPLVERGSIQKGIVIHSVVYPEANPKSDDQKLDQAFGQGTESFKNKIGYLRTVYNCDDSSLKNDSELAREGFEQFRKKFRTFHAKKFGKLDFEFVEYAIFKDADPLTASDGWRVAAIFSKEELLNNRLNDSEIFENVTFQKYEFFRKWSTSIIKKHYRDVAAPEH